MADKLEAELRKLNAAVKKLAVDQAELRRDAATKDELNAVHEDISRQLEALSGSSEEQKRATSALASAMTEAIRQLAMGKSVEVRLTRLEEAVFGSKH